MIRSDIIIYFRGQLITDCIYYFRSVVHALLPTNKRNKCVFLHLKVMYKEQEQLPRTPERSADCHWL